MKQTEQMLKDLANCGKYYSYSMTIGKLLENSKQGTVLICFTLKKLLLWQDEYRKLSVKAWRPSQQSRMMASGVQDNTVELESGSQIPDTLWRQN